MAMEELTKKFMESLAEKDKFIEKQNESIAKQQEAIELQNENMNRQQEAIEKLIDRLTQSDASSVGHVGASSASRGTANVGHAPRSADEIRKDKYLNLFQNLQKCTKFKDYKFSSQENVREWIKKFDLQLGNLATACDLKLTSLTRSEYINLMKSKLDFTIITEIELKLRTSDPALNRDGGTT